jgi:hypothetical protein
MSSKRSNDMSSLVAASSRPGTKRTLADLNLSANQDPAAFLDEESYASPVSRRQQTLRYSMLPQDETAVFSPSSPSSSSRMQSRSPSQSRSRSPSSSSSRMQSPSKAQSPAQSRSRSSSRSKPDLSKLPEEEPFDESDDEGLQREQYYGAYRAARNRSSSRAASPSYGLEQMYKSPSSPRSASSRSAEQRLSAAQRVPLSVSPRTPSSQPSYGRPSGRISRSPVASMPVSPRTRSSQPSYGRPSGRMSRSGSRSPYQEVSVRSSPSQRVMDPMLDELREFVNWFNDGYDLKLKDVHQLGAEDVVMSLFDPTKTFFDKQVGHITLMTFDHAYTNSAYRDRFMDLAIPESVQNTVTPIELMDLMWVLSWYRSVARSPQENVKMVRKVYNSSSRALKRFFGTDDRVACVVQLITGGRVTAVDYLPFKGRSGTKLNDFLPNGLYMYFKYATTFEGVNQLAENDRGLVIYTAPSLEIKERADENRRAFLDLEDPSSFASFFRKLRLADVQEAVRLANGSLEDKALLLNMILDRSA